MGSSIGLDVRVQRRARWRKGARASQHREAPRSRLKHNVGQIKPNKRRRASDSEVTSSTLTTAQANTRTHANDRATSRVGLAFRPLPLCPVTFCHRFLFLASESDAVVGSVPAISVCMFSVTYPESYDSVSEQSATRFSRTQEKLDQEGGLDGKEVDDVFKAAMDEYQRLAGEQLVRCSTQRNRTTMTQYRCLRVFRYVNVLTISPCAEINKNDIILARYACR